MCALTTLRAGLFRSVAAVVWKHQTSHLRKLGGELLRQFRHVAPSSQNFCRCSLFSNTLSTTLLRINDTETPKLTYDTFQLVEETYSDQEKMDKPAPMKTKQVCYL